MFNQWSTWYLPFSVKELHNLDFSFLEMTPIFMLWSENSCFLDNIIGKTPEHPYFVVSPIPKSTILILIALNIESRHINASTVFWLIINPLILRIVTMDSFFFLYIKLFLYQFFFWLPKSPLLIKMDYPGTMAEQSFFLWLIHIYRQWK